MIFLNPALLLGLLAASIPVLIHLFNLRKLKRIEFSTLSFLKELQKNKIRKIKIKQWLLLGLRVLIILFLVLAFARPTLEGVALGGTTSAAKTTAIFILDDTFSMSVVDPQGSYLNQAKETIKELAGHLQEGDEAALILVSNKDEEIRAASNLVEVIKAVDDINISYSSGLIHNSIIKAANVLGESKNFNKEIYLLSDFQSGRLADDQSLSNLSNLLSENVKLYAFDYSGKDIYNIGVDKIKVNTQIFEKDKPVNFSVTVTNYSNQNVENAVVSLFINGERSVQQSVSLNEDESKILFMDAIIKAAGFIDVFIEIEDDEIIYDNRRYTNLFIPSEIPVIIFSENESDSRFVELALTAAENERSLKVTKRNINQISSYDLSKFEVVIIAASENINNIERLNSFVNNGGGLFLMPGSESTLINFQNAVKAFGLPEPSSEVGEEGNTANPVSFGNIDFQHPVFQNIFADQEKKKIESPEIYHYFKINPSGKGETIIPLIDGSAFLSEYKSGSGKIFLLNTAPVLNWSSFPLKSIFVPLMNKSIFYLAFKNRPEIDYYAGNNIDINLRDQSSPQIKIERPDKTDDLINLKNLQNKNFIDYHNTDLAGNYRIYSGSNLIDYISVNADPQESKAEYLGEDALQRYLNEINFKGTFIMVSNKENPAEIILQARFGSELWKYFLIIALILALTEMAIARNAKKDLAEVK